MRVRKLERKDEKKAAGMWEVKISSGLWFCSFRWGLSCSQSMMHCSLALQTHSCFLVIVVVGISAFHRECVLCG